MNDSAARAERFDPAPSLAPFYTWEVPQKPVLVRLPLILIDRLEREAVENFRSVSSRGSEIGGVLWGSVEPGDPTALSVAEYDMVPCDYTRGPLYRLSESDMVRVDRALAQRGGSGLRPVGFFRSHTRKGLSLDTDDLALMESRFKEPFQVALVIRPYATKPSTAGIFIREGGAIHGETSYLEFPFRSAQLAPSKHPADAVELAANPAVNPPAALPTPAAPKPAVRAQIVPIAPRREIAAVAAPAAAEPAPPPAAQPVAQLLPQPVPQPVAQATVQPQPQPVAQPQLQPVPQPVVQAAVQPLPPVAQPVAQAVAQPEVEAPETAPAVEPPMAAAEKAVEPEAPVEDAAIASPAAPARTRGASKVIWFAVGAIFPLLLSGILFVYPGVFRRATLPGGIAGQDSSPLALRVERTGSELLLTWNNDSSAIRNASRAVLTISDGEQHENVDMDLAQLRNGRIEYLPVTGDVVFRMEVSGKDNARTASESVRVLRTRPSPMPPDAQNQAAPNQPAKPSTPNGTPNVPNAPTNATAGSNPPAPNTPAPNTPSTDPATAAQASPPVAPLKPFNTASLSARLRPVVSEEVALPDAPTAGRGDSMAASDTALKLTAVNPAALPPAPRKAEAPAAASKPAAMPTGGEVEQAQLIFRKNPDYPALARSAGAKGAVELVATIGINGRVKSVKVTKGHPLLQKAAVDAVMQWQYKPTMLNGRPVETETNITLNFVSDR
jgi:periplasmic protein TonB